MASYWTPLLIFLGLWYFARPVAVLWSGRHPTRYELKPGNAEDWEGILWDPARKLFKDLSEIGFLPVACSNIGGTHSWMFFIILRPASGSKTATVMLGTNNLGSQLAFEFEQRYSDGSSVSLTNSRNAPVYPSWDKHRIFRLPGEENVKFLSAKFDRLVESLGKKLPVASEPGAELADAEFIMNEQLEYLVQRGFLERNILPDGRKYTVIGAYRAALSQMWPISQILLWVERRKTLRQIDA